MRSVMLAVHAGRYTKHACAALYAHAVLIKIMCQQHRTTCSSIQGTMIVQDATESTIFPCTLPTSEPRAHVPASCDLPPRGSGAIATVSVRMLHAGLIMTRRSFTEKRVHTGLYCWSCVERNAAHGMPL